MKYEANFMTRDGEDRAIVIANSFDEALIIAEEIAERRSYQVWRMKSEEGVTVFTGNA